MFALALASMMFAAAAPSPGFDHAAWDAILHAAVHGRSVDYDAVAKRRAALDAYLARVAGADVSSLEKADVLAFYVNAYNATVLAAVLDANRPKTVMDVPGFFDKTTHVIAGEALTLNQLEETKIRSAGDPRVHFAVNCASFDCPPLAAKAWSGKTLDRDLENATKAYLSRKDEVKVDDNLKIVTVVQIFEWYRGDFGDDAKVRAFIAKYVDKKTAHKILDPAYELGYRPYDWRSNAMGVK